MHNARNIKIILGLVYILLVFLFIMFFFKYFSLKDFTSFELIKTNRDRLDNFKNTNIVLSILVFFSFTVIWVLLLGFGSPIFLIGGFIFGKWLGTFIVLLGLTSGATLLYILANFILKDFIYSKFFPKFYYLVNKFKKNEFLYFIIYRIIGGIPFFIQNLLPTLFNIKIKNYFFGSIIGLAPQIFIGVSLGSGINNLIDKSDEMPSFFEMILAPEIYLPIIAFIIILILAFIIRKKFFKNNNGAPTQN